VIGRARLLKNVCVFSGFTTAETADGIPPKNGRAAHPGLAILSWLLVDDGSAAQR